MDPNFARAYDEVGWDYLSQSEMGRASEYFTKAFELREHATHHERLNIEWTYYLNVTGELDKAVQIDKEWIAAYPRDPDACNSLGLVYATQGEYEKAIDITKQGVALGPDQVVGFWKPSHLVTINALGSRNPVTTPDCVRNRRQYESNARR